jgi:adenylylsulfate reductase subunit B
MEENMPPVINMEKCKPCGICTDICPTDVFARGPKKDPPVIKYADECWHCNSCALDCPQDAIALRIPLPAMMLYVDGAGKQAGM